MIRPVLIFASPFIASALWAQLRPRAIWKGWFTRGRHHLLSHRLVVCMYLLVSLHLLFALSTDKLVRV